MRRINAIVASCWNYFTINNFSNTCFNFCKNNISYVRRSVPLSHPYCIQLDIKHYLCSCDILFFENGAFLPSSHLNKENKHLSFLTTTCCFRPSPQANIRLISIGPLQTPSRPLHHFLRKYVNPYFYSPYMGHAKNTNLPIPYLVYNLSIINTLKHQNNQSVLYNCGPGSVVGIATGYELDGPGIEW